MDKRCVLLDIGGVLEITPRTGWDARWERRLGLQAGAVDHRLADVWRAGGVGTLGEHEIRARVAGTLGLDPAGLDAFMADLWEEYLGTPNEELIAYLRGLRQHCTLGILSNSFVGARERETAAYGFDELVEEIVYSHEIGLLKPDPRAFAAACERLGVRPEQCLFIDDVRANVEAAEHVGMRAHLFTGIEDNPRTLARIADHLGTAAPGPA